MKLSAREVARYILKPDPGMAGLLIYGTDAMRVAIKRKEAVDALLGENAEDEMRLTRLSSGDVRGDPASVADGLKAQGFFPGPRAVLVDEANESSSKAIIAALEDWQDGDATLVVTSGSLRKTSALRKAFEAHPKAVAAGIYDDPLSRDEIERAIAKAKLGDVSSAGMEAISALAAELDPGEFAQTLEKIALYTHGSSDPIGAQDVEAVTPQSTEAEIDHLLHAVAEGDVRTLGPLMSKFEAQGLTPTTLCIGASRHLRMLHSVASHKNGPDAGIAGLRPPVFGPRRDRLMRQARAWSLPALERAISMLLETDLALRSSSNAPLMAQIERSFIRIAMMRRH